MHSLRMYNSLVEKCFKDCVESFRRKDLESSEEKVRSRRSLPSPLPHPPPRPPTFLAGLRMDHRPAVPLASDFVVSSPSCQHLKPHMCCA